MNLFKLAEVRSNLDRLVSLSNLPDPYDLMAEVDQELQRLGLLRTTIFADAPEVVEKPQKTVVVVPPSIRTGPVRRHCVPGADSAERYTPYRLLWIKVIIRAAYDYALWRESKELRLRKFAQDAERWLFESSSLELSFENICFAFDFPMERIRRRARELTKDDVKKLEFRERHGRTELREVIGGGDD